MPTLALEFPPIENIVEWPAFLFEGTPFAFNKIALGYLIAVVATLAIFMLAGRRRALVPKGVQNVAEASVEFVQKGIIEQAIGHGGTPFAPFLTALFFFVLFNNMLEVVPGWQMPGNARMAMPIFLGVLVLLLFVAVGVRSQGPGTYLKNSLFPPGLPKGLYVLVTPIELISTFLVRPFSLAVRLFANMLAGHILLISFAVLSAALWVASWQAIFLPLPFAMLVALTGFEILVALLQAYIFTILTAVYIGGALHPEH
ncbi:MAG: F0F1 ATP synthase subunit A [Acidimicrobiales bacterium]